MRRGARNTSPGGRAALPIWMDYMRYALKDVASEVLPRPQGLVSVRINPGTGKLADVAKRRSAEEGVHRCVHENVGIRVARRKLCGCGGVSVKDVGQDRTKCDHGCAR